MTTHIAEVLRERERPRRRVRVTSKKQTNDYQTNDYQLKASNAQRRAQSIMKAKYCVQKLGHTPVPRNGHELVLWNACSQGELDQTPNCAARTWKLLLVQCVLLCTTAHGHLRCCETDSFFFDDTAENAVKSKKLPAHKTWRKSP